MVHPGRNLSRPGECPVPKEGVADHTIGVASMSLPIVCLYRPFPESEGPSAPPRHRATHWFFIGHHPSYLDRRCPSKASSFSVWARFPALRPGEHWLTSSCTARVHRSGSSFWSRSREAKILGGSPNFDRTSLPHPRPPVTIAALIPLLWREEWEVSPAKVI